MGQRVIEVPPRLPIAWANIGGEKWEMLEASGGHTTHGDVKPENLNESSTPSVSKGMWSYDLNLASK